MSRIVRMLSEVQEAKATAVTHDDSREQLSVSLDNDDGLKAQAVGRQSSAVNAAASLLEEYDSLKEDLFELQEEQKAVLLKLGNAVERLKEMTGKE